MSGYVSHLERIYSPREFDRKTRYIEYNFGRLLAPGMSILEVGPGMGEFLEVMKRRGTSVVDVLERDPAVADRIRSRHGIRKCWVAALEDIGTIAGELAAYDLIYLSQVLEHVRKDALGVVLRTLHGSLKPGGRLVAVVPNGGNPLCAVERYADLTHECVFSPNSIRQLVEEAGLKGCQVEIRGYRMPLWPPINIVRRGAQKLLHGVLLAVMIANAGNYCTILEPNISLVLTRSRE